MLPRYAADYRALLWLTLAIGILILEYSHSYLVFFLFPINIYFAICAGVIAHNHNHCPMFASKRSNGILGHVLTFFYGYPTFVWVPTHNLNHHKHVNRAGDATITWRHTDRHNLWVAASYFFVSSYHQTAQIKAFLAKAKATNSKLFRRVQWQYTVWLSIWFAVWLTGVMLHGLRRGTVLWLLGVGLPALSSVWTIMFFNYEQHVHTDPWSAHNHSRNFVGPIINFLLFNNGYHTVHHNQPGLHWSKTPQEHRKIAHQIDVRLQQRNVLLYWFNNFFVSLFWPAFGTQQVGRAAFDPPPGISNDLTTDEIQLGEAGTNTDMVTTGHQT
ncbi:Fatty acid desaturase [Anatilimnocola aggregata]|uniref:Fatty acid desaturase n=1 Tax=Anatilimnocola aggregata TaxID=2528021 RepID=A0A517YBE0_9BACT|nr:fatty acid desaturase [Anatilimnocola aggregata]QDU27442.1 Fatty acid desaturase [Anatilimnocola aggregata]